MHPVLIEIGRFGLPTYGVLVALAVLASLWTVKRRGDRAGLDGARLVDLCLWVLIWALVGSKATLVMVELPRYLANPGELVGVLRAGGVFLGGFLSALVAGLVLVRRYGMPWLPTLDVIIPSLALGHAIGRIGCLMAGCCWGSPCALPWAVTYTDPRAAANVGTPLGVAVHPFPLYEASFDFALYLGLAWLFWRRLRPGLVFAAYLIAYGAGRFGLELTRGDYARGLWFGGVLSTSQLLSAGMVAVGLTMLVSLLRSAATAATSAAPDKPTRSR
jgi:phosphatidylglycerol---prolipoprotein diacylglyceryl transferase